MNWLIKSMVLVLTCWFGVSASAAKNNIVLFVADDLGTDLGCYGNTQIETPHIDRLAREGTLFRQAFATTASCSASRSVILTGLHNHANAQYGHTHDYHHFSTYARIKSLPQYLAEAGYRTARVGKYHVAPESVYEFQEVIPSKSTRDVVSMVDAARELIAADSERPFFLYICTSDPHRGGGQAKNLPHQPDRFGNKPNGNYKGISKVEYSPGDVTVPPFLPDTPACRAELAQYYQAVSRVDQGFGYLVKSLQDAGVYDDTLIVLISDHGIAMPGAKTTVYEPGLRSPCIVRLPGAKNRGTENSAMISWVDLTPTILDFAGCLNEEEQARTANFHGRSFLPIVEESEPTGWDGVFASHTFHEIQMYYPMRVVRERKYKMIWNVAHPLPFPFASDLWAAPTWQAQYKLGPDAPYGVRTVSEYIHRPQFELYDLENDPHEAKNLADEPEYAEVLSGLKKKLKEFQKETDDPWILKWEYE